MSKRRRVSVASAAALDAALASARPGDHIRLAPGVYRGTFVAVSSGTPEAPITLCGPRGAILEQRSIESGYGFHLKASHWYLLGFSVRHASKGIVTDGARHNVLRDLEISGIGEEGIHFRSASTDNTLERSWVHHVGLKSPLFGEGVYIGSAASNWKTYSQGQPDASSRNRVVGNVIGPGIAAECVDAKEGTTEGVIADNVFLGTGAGAADSWVDLKGNRYQVFGNSGTFDPTGAFARAVMVQSTLPEWGKDNRIRDNIEVSERPGARGQPFRASYGQHGPVSLVLPGRRKAYTLAELAVRFPQSVQSVGAGTLLLREHLVVGPDARLVIRAPEVQELRLYSGPRGLASLVGVRARVEIAGAERARVRIRSWDPALRGPDRIGVDGRAFLTAMGGAMDMSRADVTDLGFGTGWTSGAAWKGGAGGKCRGAVANCRFERNFIGAYTFEADSMRWTDNVFANNAGYGFDPHDHSDYFTVTGNRAHDNGSHGIIFSRGCRGNVVRGNFSYSNRGHGIMLDDGKVANDGDPRHLQAVPSTGNVVDTNEVWNNDVGIALQGGNHGWVRGNLVHDNRFGVRLHQSVGNMVTGNTIRGTRESAIYLYDGSDGNHVVDNRIHGGQGGIVVKNSVGNVVENNAIQGVTARGLVIAGRADLTTLRRNRISGRGSQAIDVGKATGLSPDAATDNRTRQWISPRLPLLPLLVWSIVLIVPPVMMLSVRRKRRSHK